MLRLCSTSALILEKFDLIILTLCFITPHSPAWCIPLAPDAPQQWLRVANSCSYRRRWQDPSDRRDRQAGIR
uniref:Putative secreted protein n=1 Tax=Anopheles triannulatus TaxID=58253 RepID=A0A2M4B5H0_9DIPT